MIRVLTVALTLALLLGGSTLDVPAQSEAPPIKIGYAISRTRPTAPDVARNAMRFSPSRRTRSGAPSRVGSSFDSAAGTQY